MTEQLEKSASEINYLKKTLSQKTGMINDFVNKKATRKSAFGNTDSKQLQ